MRSFKKWVAVRENKNNTTALFMGRTPNSSELRFSLDEPSTQNSTLPWQMNSFRGWYDFHKGNWGEVERAAQSNPRVAQLLQNIQRQMVTQGVGAGHKPINNPYVDSEFDLQLDAPTKMGELGDELEKAVKDIIPSHGYQRNNWKVPPQYKDRAQSNATQSVTQQIPPDADSAQLINHLWQRQDRLEKKVDYLMRISSAA